MEGYRLWGDGDWAWRVIDCGVMVTGHGGLLTVGGWCGDWAWRVIDCGVMVW